MESFGFYWNHFVELETQSLRGLLELLGIHGYAGARPALSWLYSQIPLGIVLLILLVGEFVVPWKRAQRKWRPGLGLDMFYTLIHTALFFMLFGKAFVATLVLAFMDSLESIVGTANNASIYLNGIPMWSRVVAMLLYTELQAYLGHWLLHNVGFLWEFHKVHHCSAVLDVWNAQRFHVGEQTFWPLASAFPAMLIGFPPGEVVFVAFLTSLFSYYTHSNIRIPLGPLKYVINNPQLHIWHHAATIDPKRNVNYGDATCMFDYLFGTAYLPGDRPGLKLGFAAVEDYPTNFLGQFVTPFRAIGARIWARLASVPRMLPG